MSVFGVGVAIGGGAWSGGGPPLKTDVGIGIAGRAEDGTGGGRDEGGGAEGGVGRGGRYDCWG